MYIYIYSNQGEGAGFAVVFVVSVARLAEAAASGADVGILPTLACRAGLLNHYMRASLKRGPNIDPNILCYYGVMTTRSSTRHLGWGLKGAPDQ